jgi:Ca2+-binding RTX toxin-like protein
MGQLIEAVGNTTVLNGGAGNDTLIGNVFTNNFVAGAGNDLIQSSQRQGTILGGTGEDTAVFSYAFDDLLGVSGLVQTTSSANGTIFLHTAGTGSSSRWEVEIDGVEHFQFADRSFTFAELVNEFGPNVGTAGNDTITDPVSPYRRVSGLEGNDRIVLTNQPATIFGGAGDDHITSSGRFGRTFGQEGNDTLDGTPHNSFLSGDEGDDLIHITGWSNSINGGPGNDTLQADGIGNAFLGGRGHETDYDIVIFDRPFTDATVEFGEPNGVPAETVWFRFEGETHVTSAYQIDEFRFTDRVVTFQEISDQFNNTHVGTAGNDQLFGSDGTDYLDGKQGNDWLHPGLGQATVIGGAGTDMLSFGDIPVGQQGLTISASSMRAWAADGSVNVTGFHIENFTGTSGNDFFTANGWDHLLRGLGGNDTFLVGYDSELRIDGGGGWDLLSYNWYGFNEGISLSLLRGRGWEGRAADDRFTGIEHVAGGYGDDFIVGDHNHNRLFGGHGNDTLVGNGGNDVMDAGSGHDVVIFGYNQDQYSITQSGRATIIEYTGFGPGDGLDTVINAEVLRFADGDLLV